MNRLTIVARLEPETGYGQTAINLIRALRQLGWHINTRSLTAPPTNLPADIAQTLVYQVQPESLELLIAYPREVPTPGKRTLFFTTWESTILPAPYVANLNKAEMVIVPGVWNAHNFETSGVGGLVRICPLGFDPEIFKPAPWPVPCGPFVFTAAGTTKTGALREGVNDVITCFQEAFPDESNVRLWIKTRPGDLWNKRPDNARIDFFDAVSNDAGISDFLANGHVFVSCARGEAWGLWPLQACACARPVIATRYGGHLEFMKPWACYLVDAVKEDAQETFTGCGQWGKPNMEQVIAWMQTAYKHREHAEHLGQQAAKAVAGFTWANAAKRLVEIIEEVDKW